MILYLIQGLSLGFGAAALPGIMQAYLLSETMRNGWRRTLPASLAPILSDGPIIALLLLVFTQAPDWFLLIIQFIGGGFLLYLSWSAYRAFKNFDLNAQMENAPKQQSLLQASLTNLLNPNPYIFWGTIGVSLLLEAWHSSPRFGVVFLLAFYVTLIGGFATQIMLFDLARRAGSQVARTLMGISAIVLFVLGLFRLSMGMIDLIG